MKLSQSDREKLIIAACHLEDLSSEMTRVERLALGGELRRIAAENGGIPKGFQETTA